MIYNKHNTGLHGEQWFIWGQDIKSMLLIPVRVSMTVDWCRVSRNCGVDPDCYGWQIAEHDCARRKIKMSFHCGKSWLFVVRRGEKRTNSPCSFTLRWYRHLIKMHSGYFLSMFKCIQPINSTWSLRWSRKTLLGRGTFWLVQPPDKHQKMDSRQFRFLFLRVQCHLIFKGLTVLIFRWNAKHFCLLY